MHSKALICSVTVLAAFVGLNQAWAQYDPGQSDLALNKSGTSTGADCGATFGMGVDGNRNGNFGAGSVFYENAGTPPLFYQVDLGANQYVNRIQFLPRTDATQSVFGNFNISVFPDNGSGNPAAVPTYSRNFNTTYFGAEFATALPGLTPGGSLGRFVRIERLDNNYWLTFAEMEVVGSSAPLTHG